MKKAINVILMLTAMVLVMILAVCINKVVNNQKDKKWEEERVVRTVEVSALTEAHEEEIKKISQKSKEEIESYIEENAYVDEEEEIFPEDIVIYDPWAGDIISEDISGNEIAEEELSDISGNDISGNDISGNDISGNDISGNDISGNDISGNDISGNDISGNDISGNDISGNGISGNDISGNGISANSLSGEADNILTLKMRQKLRTSFEETDLWIRADEDIIRRSTLDWSGKKIACIGDSITEGVNLPEGEEYEQYTYPSVLGRIFDASTVNLGIGGSSLGRYWDQAFCDRYDAIPEDTDVIIIMGGTNDGFCLHEDMVGDIDEREPRTLYGDVDDLFKGIREDYPEAEVYVVTPLPNLLHDVLRKERENLLSQTVVVDCLKTLADEYDITVIDNYNSNFMDSHDADIVSEYIPDSVHPNEEGYELLAKHIAAEIIRSNNAYEEKEEEIEETEGSDGNTDEEDEAESDAGSEENDEPDEADVPDKRRKDTEEE